MNFILSAVVVFFSIQIVIGDEFTDAITFDYYDGGESPIIISYDNISTIGTISTFVDNISTIIVFPGRGDYSEFQETISAALVSTNNTNVILISYRDLVNHDVVLGTEEEFCFANRLSFKLAEALDNFVKAYSNSSVVCLCHGYGCKVAGKTLENALNQYHIVADRLIALDPVNCYQYTLDNIANFCEVHITDAGFESIIFPTGNVSYYLDYGTRPQKHCVEIDQVKLDSRCSHDMAWRYFAESCTSPNAFLAEECFGECEGSTNPGYWSDESATGSFLVMVNVDPPYGGYNYSSTTETSTDSSSTSSVTTTTTTETP